MSNPVVKGLLHPVLILTGLLSWLAVYLPQNFHLAPIWTWIIATAVAFVPLLTAQLDAAHVDLAIPVQLTNFHAWIVVATLLAAFFQFLQTSIATAPASLAVPAILPALLALAYGVCNFLANQLNLQDPSPATTK